MANYANHEEDPLISNNTQPHSNVSKPLARELKPAIEAIHFITEKLRLEDEQEMVEDDWQYIAMIVDRPGLSQTSTFHGLFSVPVRRGSSRTPPQFRILDYLWPLGAILVQSTYKYFLNKIIQI